MIPRLYDSFNTTSAKGATDFIGTITNCHSCFVKEIRNGEYTLELETSINDSTAGELLSQRIISAKPNPHDPVQCFEIQSTERTTDGNVKVSAKHVKNFACNLVSLGSISYTDIPDTYNLTPEGVWNRLFNNTYIEDACPFTFTSDITAKADFYLGFNAPKTLGAILGGEEGSMIDMYGGELHFDNYSISLLRSRGQSTGYALRYGCNIENAKQREECTQTYSHVLPFGSVSRSDGKYINIYSDLIEIPDNDSKTKKVFILDCSDAAKQIQVGMQGAYYDDARALMTAFANRYISTSGIGNTNVAIDVTARAELDEMQTLALCDTVKVILNDTGITTTAKITTVVYDVLLERWQKMTVGTAAVKLSDLFLNKQRYNL